MIDQCTRRYGKLKLVLIRNQYFIESERKKTLEKVLKDPVLSETLLSKEIKAQFLEQV
jgi:hypothetical protein